MKYFNINQPITMKKLTKSAEILFDYARSIPTIDTHEHIPANESDYNSTPITFGELFIPYIVNDLYSSGMKFDIKGNMRTVPFYMIKDDWDAFEPYWNNVKYGGYARSLRIALKKYYGIADLTRENHKTILAKINENNKPGIIKRVMQDDCNIVKSINCRNEISHYANDFVLSNISTPSLICNSKAGIDIMLEYCGGSKIKNIDELVELGNIWMEMKAKEGAIEFKGRANPVTTPDKTKAEAELQRILKGENLIEWDIQNLTAYVFENNIRKAAELDRPVAVHTGVWHDFRNLDILDTLSFIERNPGTRFDIYHLGIPYPRTALQIIKNFPNAYMNLCWAHIVAPEMLIQSMIEAIDMVPMNKIFAFGADYVRVIEKVYGHLQIAKENISIILGDRVDKELMDIDTAKETMLKWFYKNPVDFYRID